MDLKDIKSIIDLMKKNDLSVFEMEKEGFKIRLKKGSSDQGGYAVTSSAPVPMFHTPPVPQSISAPAPAMETAAPAPTPKGPELVSPMVGTFYVAMSPESPAYLKVGQTVTKDETVICIIEAMKVMNEIKAEASGVVAEVVAENGKPVQFGQALFRLQ